MTAVLLCGLLLSGVQAAVPERLIPGGDAIGLELDLEGVSVVELATDIPEKAGLRCGDLIYKVNGTKLSTVEELQKAVQASDGKLMEFSILRDGEEIVLKLSPLQTAEGWKLGIYVRDHLKGIGTVTYYEEDGDFGALGHGVSGNEGKELLPLKGGDVLPSEVASVVKGKAGTPGCLRGAWKEGTACGKVERNTPQGIFGTMKIDRNEPFPRRRSSPDPQRHSPDSLHGSRTGDTQLRRGDLRHP